MVAKMFLSLLEGKCCVSCIIITFYESGISYFVKHHVKNLERAVRMGAAELKYSK